MSLLDSNNFIEITVYYMEKSIKGGNKIIVIKDDKLEKIINDEEKMKKVKKINTKWKLPSWEDQNKLLANASKWHLNTKSDKSTLEFGDFDPNQQSEKMTNDFDLIYYRDMLVKKCLKEWDLTINEKPAPVTDENINKLPDTIVTDMYEKFDKFISYSEDDLGN